MNYITHRRFKTDGLCGSVNIPALSECISYEGIIFFRNDPICYATSENAHQFFAVNDDNNGLERGKLTQAIQKCLAKRDQDHQKRWDKVWSDDICQKYRRKEHNEHWLWNHEFFGANIYDLRYIANLIGVKVCTK